MPGPPAGASLVTAKMIGVDMSDIVIDSRSNSADVLNWTYCGPPNGRQLNAVHSPNQRVEYGMFHLEHPQS